MKACVNCKYHIRYSAPWRTDWCKSPQAKRFSRIDGPQSLDITPEVLIKCDENGWFVYKHRNWLVRYFRIWL